MLSYRTLKVLADLDPAVAEVTGFTRYRIDGDTVTIVDRGASRVTCRRGSTPIRGWSAPSTASPSLARCSWLAAAATSEP